MTRTLLTLLLALAPLAPCAAQARGAPPSSSVERAEALGAARVLLEQAAFAEAHERDCKRAVELFGRAAEAGKAAGDAALVQEAAAGAARCQAKLGTGAPDVAAGLPVSAYGMLTSKEALLYGDRLLPALRRAIQVGHVFGPDGKRYELSQGEALAQLVALRTPQARGTLRVLMESEDPLLRIGIVKHLLVGRHEEELVKALKDPVAQIRAAAVVRLRAGKPRLPAAICAALEPLALRSLGAAEVLASVAPERLARVLAAPGLSAAQRREIAQILNVNPRPSSQVFSALLVAAEKKLIPIYDLRGISSLPALDEADLRRLEDLLHTIPAAKAHFQRERLVAALHRVVGEATIKRGVSGGSSLVPAGELSRWVALGYRAVGKSPARLHALGNWLALDLQRMGAAEGWQANLRSALLGLAESGEGGREEHLLRLIELTLSRFGRQAGASILSVALQGRRGCVGAKARARIEARLRAIDPSLPFAMQIASRASLEAYLESDPSPWETRRVAFQQLWVHGLRDAEAVTDGWILARVARAHPVRRPLAIRCGLEHARRLGRGRVAFEERLVKLLSEGERQASAELLLSELEAPAAWRSVAQGAIARVGSLTKGTQLALDERVEALSPAYAVRALPRLWQHYSPRGGIHPQGNPGDRWARLATRFPAESLEAAREAIRAAKEGLLPDGENERENLLWILVGKHPRGLELFVAEREALRAAKLESGMAHALLESSSQPLAALDVLCDVPGPVTWEHKLLQAIAEARYAKGLHRVESGLRHSDRDVRDAARAALAALTAARQEEEDLARLRTGLSTRELRELAKLLEDDSAEVAGSAARALGRLGDPAALPVLVRRMRSADDALQLKIEDAINALTPGKKPGGGAASPQPSKRP